MKIITRQFAREIILHSIFVLLVLVALFAFFDLIGRLDNVGRNDYSLMQAFTFTALILPDRAYQIMPIAALLAGVYTLSRWAATSEFICLRVAGMSPLGLAKSLLVPGIFLVILTFVFGEAIAPPAYRYTQVLRVEAAGDSNSLGARGYVSGAWIRDVVKDAQGQLHDRYINVASLSAKDRNVTMAWRIYDFDESGHLASIIRAKRGVHVEGGWQLEDVVETTFPKLDRKDMKPVKAGVDVKPRKSLVIRSDVSPQILNVMTTKPENLSVWDLDDYVQHLKRNHQQVETYEIVFWKKVFYPFAVLVMLAMSMPFAYMNARSGGMAIKVFFGVMLGIVFYGLNNLSSYLGMVNGWSPVAVSALPSVVMLLGSAIALVWVEKR